MPVNMAFFHPMGTPIQCYLAEYMRTIVYEVVGLFVKESDQATSRVVNNPGLSAWVSTDPVDLLENQDFSVQWNLIPEISQTLQSKIDGHRSRQPIYVVIQVKQDMDCFPAIDGQCIRTETETSEMLFIAKCMDAAYPEPDERGRDINTLLTSIRAEFGVTEPLEKQIDSSCYRTTDNRILHPLRAEFNMRPRVDRPMSGKDLSERAESSRTLFEKISRNIEGDVPVGQSRRKRDYGSRLEELTEALFLEPTTDDSYLQLWYMRLCDRLEKFGESISLQVWNKNNNRVPDLEQEKDHRDEIAHRGAEKIDSGLLKSLQAKTFRIIKSGIWPRD